MPAKLVEKITAKTKWIILNSPSNPTGMKYSKEELEGIAKVLENYPHIGIVSDDIYEDVNFTGEALSLIDIAPGLLDRILVVNGLSKSYAMTGWRIGYSLGNKEIINAMKIIQSQSTSNPCSISQYAALEALTGDQIFPKSLGNIFKERCNVALKELRDIDGVSCLSPEGAFYLFPSCKKFLNKRTQEGTIIKNDYDFCEYLLADAKVAVVPGSSFGLSGYFRISYAVSKETIVEGIQKIKESCNKLI
jgi:aspartate aminotransferase